MYVSVTVRVTSHAGLLFSAREVIHDGVEAADKESCPGSAAVHPAHPNECPGN